MNSSPGVVQQGANTGQKEGAGQTREQHETRRITVLLSLQNLHPRFNPGGASKFLIVDSRTIGDRSSSFLRGYGLGAESDDESTSDQTDGMAPQDPAARRRAPAQRRADLPPFWYLAARAAFVAALSSCRSLRLLPERRRRFRSFHALTASPLPLPCGAELQDEDILSNSLTAPRIWQMRRRVGSSSRLMRSTPSMVTTRAPTLRTAPR